MMAAITAALHAKPRLLEITLGRQGRWTELILQGKHQGKDITDISPLYSWMSPSENILITSPERSQQDSGYQ